MQICNARDNISGALVCRQDIYLQMLEGSFEAVNATYMRICRDDRHVGVRKLVSRRTSNRFFSDWAMLHDPAISLIWNQQQISAGILDLVPQSEIIGMFEAISHRWHKACHTYHTCHIQMAHMIDMTHMIATAPEAERPSSR